MQAEVFQGKYTGTWAGRVTVRSRGVFVVRVADGTRAEVSHKVYRLRQRSHGWQPTQRRTNIKKGGKAASSPPGRTEPPPIRMENLNVSIKRGQIRLQMEDSLKEPVVHCTGDLNQSVEGSLLRLEATTRQTLDLNVVIPSTIRHLNPDLESGTARITAVTIDTADINVGNGAILAGNISGQWDMNIGRGELTVQGGNGSFDYNAGVGSVHLQSVQNSTADINAGLGPVRLEHSQGTFDINAGKGDVTVDDFGEKIKVNAGLGKIILINSQNADCELESGMGSITPARGPLQAGTTLHGQRTN